VTDKIASESTRKNLPPGVTATSAEGQLTLRELRAKWHVEAHLKE
jgi:hypothetical protein